MPFLSAPMFSVIGGNLRITSTNNVDNFGFWQSPTDAVPVVADRLYAAQFHVNCDVANAAECPQIRLRINSQNGQQADYLVIESSEDGGYSPNDSGRDYLVFFVPPVSAVGQPEDLDDMFMAIDMLNFNSQDSATGTVGLDSVIVRRIAFDDLADAQTVRTYTFDQSVEGWQFAATPDYFSAPRSSHTNGALQITATSNTDNFGYWFIPTTGFPIEANKLYRGRFKVSSNLTDLAKVPTIRLRLSTINFQATRALEIVSSGDGAHSPGRVAKTYDMYFYPPQHLVGTPNGSLLAAFDLMNFISDDSPSATVALDSVALESLDLPPLF